MALLHDPDLAGITQDYLRLALVEVDGSVDQYCFALQSACSGKLVCVTAENNPVENVVWIPPTKVDEGCSTVRCGHLTDHAFNGRQRPYIGIGILW